MIKKGKLIFKFWFKNGTYIEKEVVFDENTPQEEAEDFIKGIPKLKETTERSFAENLDADLRINNMIIRCSELIAFDIIPIVEEQQNADV